MEISKIDICQQTDELRKIILDHPELPIVVLTGSEVVADDGYGWWYGINISYAIKKLIYFKGNYDDFDIVVDDERDLEEYIANNLADEEEYEHCTDEEFDQVVKQKLEEYKTFWTECICICSDV